MKNVSRNKFLICFRPVVDTDLTQLESNSEAVVVDRSGNSRGLKYVGVKNKDNTKASTTKAPEVTVSDSKNSIMIRRPGKKTFSKVIKAVVFETMLAKRVRKRKGIDQESCSSKHDLPLTSPDKLSGSSFDESVNKVLAGKGIQDTISSSTSSCLLSSSSPSQSSSTSNSTQKAKIQHLQSNFCNIYSNHRMKPKQEGINRGSSSSSNSAIFLLLVSLAVTIFWGKICAIIFTSTWLYFLPHKQPSGEVNGNLVTIKRTPDKMQKEKVNNGRATRKEP